MIRYIPMMVLTGRLRLHRALTMLADFCVAGSFWLSFTGVLNWSVPMGLYTFFTVMFAVIGYHSYFQPVKKHQVLRVRFSRDGMTILLALVCVGEGEEFYYPLPVKEARGWAYHFYLLSIYMRLAGVLTDYARTLKDAKA